MEPARHVELKAHDPDPAATYAAALAFGARDAGVLRQRDTYFPVERGWLKLRVQDGVPAQLIADVRHETATTRASARHRVEVPDPAALAAALTAVHGAGPVVQKTRRVLRWETVSIHLDEVAGLGAFIELEVAAGPGGVESQAQRATLAALRAALGIHDAHVVAEGYPQLLTRASAPADLIEAARTAMGRARAPYSHFRVGAALRAAGEDGDVFLGTNVENAAYPESQCAEASAIGALVTAGHTRIAEVAIMADAPLITPCGGCRQRLTELAGPDTPVHLCGPEGVRQTITLGRLLPLAFTTAADTATGPGA